MTMGVPSSFLVSHRILNDPDTQAPARHDLPVASETRNDTSSNTPRSTPSGGAWTRVKSWLRVG